VGAALAAAATTLVLLNDQFGWARELSDIPALGLAAGLVAAGLAFLTLLPLVRRTEVAVPLLQRRILAGVVMLGLALRLAMLATEPALEDDQQRYLVEGALVVNGLSPYRIAPADIATAPPETPLGRIAVAAGTVLERVNHATLRTIYPPVAQAGFALAHMIGPYSLTAWRLVLLAAELATLALLLALLDRSGLPRIGVALYWLNPLVVKEVMNSGHMEGLLIPFVLAAVLLAARRRPLLAAGALGLAVGVKVWPLMLLPLLARAFRLGTAVAMAAIVAGLGALWLLPVLQGGLDAGSGFVAYASRWQANSASLPALRDGLGALLGLGRETAGMLARAILAGVVAVSALAIAARPITSPADLAGRAALLTFALVLASPAQFPWYAIWTIAFLPFAPRLSVAALAVTMPIYYVSFHFSAIGQFEVFRDRIVWVVWLPIWLLALAECADWLRRRLASRSLHTWVRPDGKGG
jgi:hypothetical protein